MPFMAYRKSSVTAIIYELTLFVLLLRTRLEKVLGISCFLDLSFWLANLSFGYLLFRHLFRITCHVINYFRTDNFSVTNYPTQWQQLARNIARINWFQEIHIRYYYRKLISNGVYRRVLNCAWRDGNKNSDENNVYGEMRLYLAANLPSCFIRNLSGGYIRSFLNGNYPPLWTEVF